jgi:Alw26I/Eco31I/Esp3I family type II restriction m6 adenine DNA methyltransferase
MDKFKYEFAIVFDALKTSPDEREEHHKNTISTFLQKVWYSPDYHINTHGDYDLVIRNGEKANTPIGVIIETKKPGKNPDMISRNNINAKSMQQLLFYFLEETLNQKNNDLKNLIITNYIEWFIFDAGDFYHHFLKNTELVRLYKEYKGKSLFGTDTSYFYKYIASPYIEKIKNDIKYTYINISDFEKIIRYSDDEDNKLIHLYKIFSPQHLLKKSFSNDSNSLNQNFYFELLYILGLSEEKEENKRIIVRNKNNRQNASFIESTIYQLCDDISVEKVLYDISFELVITWINRILFLKLLEAQLLKYQNDNKNYAFLNINKIPSFNDLNVLFFKVLAEKLDARDESVKDKFKYVPYLNSSLFLKISNEVRCSISSLQNGQMDIFPHTVLKDTSGNSRKGKIFLLDYIFSFLDAYDFSSVDSDIIQEEKKTIINASVLGLIFEKINGYKDGSYFTPGFVTSFICSETVKNLVISKFNTAKGWKAKNLKDIFNKIDKVGIEEANRIINNITILDPAVGSGHFLVSALNEIIAIKSFLGILVDNEGLKIKGYKISVVNDELEIYNSETGKLFEYSYKSKEKQRLQETMFREKRQLIENSLFGVDINKNSVKISRLRLWIELLKSAYYTKESKFSELETLPNLELNIKCGNSLISRFDIDTDLSEAIKSLKFSVQDYKDTVFNYKNSTSKETQKDLEDKIEKIKSGFTAKIKNLDKKYNRKISLKNEIMELKSQKEMFDISGDKERKENLMAKLEKELENIERLLDEIETNRIYTDAFEWRLEFPEVLNDDGNFMGFDAVIGNPPYGILNKKQNKSESIIVPDDELQYYKGTDLYTPASGGMLNIFRLFIVRSLTLLKENGIFSQIFPLAFTGDISIKILRKYVFDNTQIQFIEAFPERDNQNKRVFEAVKMSVCILQCKKTKPVSTEQFYLRINDDREISRDENKNILTSENIKFLQPDFLSFPLTSPIETIILLKTYKMGKRLIEFGSCGEGEVHMTACKSAFTDDDTKAILLKGAIIDRYILRKKMSQGEIVYIDEPVLHGLKTVDMETINNERIVMQGITGVNEKIRIKAMIVKGVYCANSLNFLSIKSNIDLKYLLGILNSKLMNFIFKKFNTNSNVNGYEVNNLPIIEADNPTQKKIIQLVDKILKGKSKNPIEDTSSFETEIDNTIYSLYNLEKSEIDIVENDLY